VFSTGKYQVRDEPAGTRQPGECPGRLPSAPYDVTAAQSPAQVLVYLS
jgi:hypothetical protein